PLRQRMLQVIAENLASNAIRYAGAGAVFTLTVDGGSLVASDSGPGVPDDELARLFERFYRGDRARASRGTGLGLAIVKHGVTALGHGDMYRLRGAIDDVCDHIDEAADNVGSYGVDRVPEKARQQADCILRAAIQLDEAVQRLEGFKDSSRQLDELRELEDE